MACFKVLYQYLLGEAESR